MFLYQTDTPDKPTFAPSADSERAREQSAQDVWNATRDLMIYRDNSDAQFNARAEAYERRNRAIFEATGVQLSNPHKAFVSDRSSLDAALDQAGPGRSTTRYAAIKGWRDSMEQKWAADVRKLALDFPEKAAAIAAERSIEEDAIAITRGAETRATAVQQQADAAGVGAVRGLGNTFGGGVAGMMRDPLQISTLLIGGGFSAPARTVAGRILQTIAMEATINAGAETALQIASQDWRQKAGVEHGLEPALKQIGLAAAFGGGIGGLGRGIGELFSATGRASPAGLVERIEADELQPGDIRTLGDALGVEITPETARDFDMAIEQTAMDTDAFGPPPAGVDDVEADRAASTALRAIEDGEAGISPQTTRAARKKRASKPVSLITFIARNGGLVDHGGEVKAIGLTRKFVPGSGMLVRAKGKPLDMQREAAAEAGFFDHIYGDRDQATSRSTIADLLDVMAAEERGQPVYASEELFDALDVAADKGMRSAASQASYDRVLAEVQAASDEFGFRADDRLLRRAAELMDDDPVIALERAFDEDYRLNADADRDFGEVYDDSDIPFFDDSPIGRQDGGAVSGPGGPAGRTGESGNSGLRSQGTVDEDGGQLPDAGESQVAPPLRAAGDTPEPGTPEAGELAETALIEAGGAPRALDDEADEFLQENGQTLVPGVTPVTTRERLEAEAAKPMRGGNAPLQEGGLFDLESRKQLDMWDAMPAATDADGRTLYTTHADLVDEADRDELFSDLIASCKD